MKSFDEALQPSISHTGSQGGTAPAPVFERDLEEPQPPAALNYLTDLDGTISDAAPPFPALWANIGNGSAPFGETIDL